MRSWGRAGALFLATLLLSVVGPVVLVLIPFACLAFTSPGKRLAPLTAGALAVLAGLAGATRSGLWYVERGWTIILGGCFAALALRRPEQRFLPRALWAVAISAAGAWAALGLSPRRWGIINEMVASRLDDVMVTTLAVVRALLMDGAPLPRTVMVVAIRAVEWQSDLFPALLALSSMAALGVAWWLHQRLARGSGEGLGPLAEFRFNDHLAWLLVAGAALFILWPDDALGRVGLNLLVFMGALFAVRGAGVVMGVTRGLPAVAWIALALSFVLLAPFPLMVALMIGLADVCLDFRARAAKT